MPVLRLFFLSGHVLPSVVVSALSAIALDGGLIAAAQRSRLVGRASAPAPAPQSGEPATDRRMATSGAGRVVSRVTPHLAFAAVLSRDVIVPGTRLSIVVDVTPKQGMHVYAPGSTYRPVAISIRPHPLLRVHDAVYPKPTVYLFKPLNEEALVYSAPFRLALDITAGNTAAQQAQLHARSRLTIKGELQYQACDETVCYLPTSVPFEWTVRIKH